MPTDEEINKWTNKLKDLQKWYEDRGIKFVIAIAPNKHSIYRERLPTWMKYDGRTITDNIVAQAISKDIAILDLRNKLLESKEKEIDILYWKTDTHWNEKGASIAFDTIINQLNGIYKLALYKPEYNLESSVRGGGDLADFLKINTILKKDHEIEYNYVFDKNYDICKGNINKDNHALEKCENISNPLIEITSQPQYMINKKSENNLNLLFLCDSFGTAPSQLYNATFNSIYKFHYRHINGQKLANFVEENKPDIVIYQIVERDFYNDGVVTTLPKISQLFQRAESQLTSGDIASATLLYLKHLQHSESINDLKAIIADKIILIELYEKQEQFTDALRLIEQLIQSNVSTPNISYSILEKLYRKNMTLSKYLDNGEQYKRNYVKLADFYLSCYLENENCRDELEEKMHWLPNGLSWLTEQIYLKKLQLVKTVSHYEKSAIAGDYSKLGEFYFRIRYWTQTEEYFRQAIKIYAELDDKRNMITVYSGLSAMYAVLAHRENLEQNMRKEVAARLKIVELSEAIGDSKRITEEYQNLIDLYQWLGEDAQEIKTKMLKFDEKIN